MTNLTKAFKITITVMLALVVIGVVFTCAFGLNSSATLGNGQQLVYNLNSTDDTQQITDDVNAFLKDNGAKSIIVQKRYDYNDKVTALLFTFKAKTDLAESVTVKGVECLVSKITSTPAIRVIKLGAVAAATAIAVIFAYLSLRFIKNNWFANSLGFVATALLNIFASYAIVQILGIVGFQFDTGIMTACIYSVLLTALLFVVVTSVARNFIEVKKLSVADSLKYSVSAVFMPVTVILGIVALACILMSFISGGAFAVMLIPVLVVTVVCYFSSLFIAPYLWRLMSKEQTSTPVEK